MNSEQLDKKEEEVSKVIISNVIQSLFKNGDLTLSDLEDKKGFWEKLTKIVKESEFDFVIDHTDSLISSARTFRATNNFNEAKIFYATYFEHQLNGIIKNICQKKLIDKKEINTIIRSINLIGKLTWLPLLLEIPKISIKHKKVILKLAEDRNAFIHYKHNPEPERLDTDDKERQEDIRQIEKIITYFKKYTSKILYNNQKTKINKKLKDEKLLENKNGR